MNILRSKSLSKVLFQPFFMAIILLGGHLLCSAQSQVQGKNKIIQEIRFKDMDIKSTLRALAKQVDLEIEFDGSVNISKVSIELQEVTIRQAIEKILEEKKLMIRMKTDKILLVFADTSLTREKFAEMKEWLGDSN